MKDHLSISPSIQRSLRIWMWIDISVVCIICFADIIGWIFNIPFLTTVGINWSPMIPHFTVFCFLLCVVALLFITIDPIGKPLNIISKLSGIAVSLVGLLTIICYSAVSISGKEISITGIPFFNLFLSPGSRMAFVTALNFLIIGIIIVLETYRKRRIANIAHTLLIIPFVLSYLVLSSNILGVYHVHEIQVIPVALNTGIAFSFLCFALFCIHPGSWLMKTFTVHRAGSQMARRLLPGLIILPLLIGWISIYGERSGLFESEVGVVLVAMAYTLCFLALVWLTVDSVNKTDTERLRNEALLSEAQRITQIGSWDWNIVTGALRWTPELFMIFGLDQNKDVASFETWNGILHPDDKPVASLKIDLAIKEHTSLDSTYRIVLSDGTIRWIRASGEGRYDENGSPVRMFGVCQDITEYKKMQEQIQYEAQRAIMLSTLSKMFTEAGLNLSEIFNLISRGVAEYIGEACIITKLSEDGEFLIPVAFHHPDPEARDVFASIFPNIPIRVGEGYVGQVALTGQSILVSGISREQLKATLKKEFWPYLDRFGINDYLIVPLKTEGRVIGTLGVMRLSQSQTYTEDDIALLEVIAGRAAMAITNTQLYEALQKSHDELEELVQKRTEELQKANMLLRDEINTRKQQENTLRIAEEKFRTVADFTFDWEYWINNEGSFHYCSPSCERITGYSAQEFKNDNNLIYKIIHPDDLNYFSNHIAHQFQSKNACEIEFRIIKKDGNERWIGHACQPVFGKNGEYLGNRGSNRDITEKVKAENDLLNITIEVEERERNRISRELHDGLGPLLSTVKLYFQWLAETDDPEKIKIITEKGNNNIERAIQTTREVSHGLSSLILNNLGYVDAVNNFTQIIKDTQNLTIDFTFNSNDRFGNFPETTLYRITTELIYNTVKHAMATHVEIIFNYYKEKNIIAFNYSDNGIGFDMADTEKASKGLGLMNIQQRIKIMRGLMRIDTGTGKGMKVFIEMPVVKTIN